jgi:AbrB family looped-hinge helix DNA binding protein
MEVAMTKISQNGQVVIPSEVRKDAGIKPSTQFLVFNQDGNILLKQIKKESLREDLLLIDSIRKSEGDIKQGKYVKVNTTMDEKEIDDLLMG